MQVTVSFRFSSDAAERHGCGLQNTDRIARRCRAETIGTCQRDHRRIGLMRGNLSHHQRKSPAEMRGKRLMLATVRANSIHAAGSRILSVNPDG